MQVVSQMLCPEWSDVCHGKSTIMAWRKGQSVNSIAKPASGSAAAAADSLTAGPG